MVADRQVVVVRLQGVGGTAKERADVNRVVPARIEIGVVPNAHRDVRLDHREGLQRLPP